MCAFVVLALAFDDGRVGRWSSVTWLIALAVLFLANIALVVTGRTTLLVAPVLVLLLGWREFGWKGALGAALLFGILGAAAAMESPYLHDRLKKSFEEFNVWISSDKANSTSEHLELMKEAVSFVRTAPIIGHGTGSIGEQYRKAAVGKTGVLAVLSVNPHNQIFDVAIQLGLVGTVVLVAMWIAHVMLFRGSGFTAWVGTSWRRKRGVLARQFASVRFRQSWLYVFGVGVAGGMTLRDRTGGREAMSPIQLPLNPRVLVVALRPARRRAPDDAAHSQPETRVSCGLDRSAGVCWNRGNIVGKPRFRQRHAISERPRLAESLALLHRLTRRYDLALTTQTGDRPAALAFLRATQRRPLEADGFPPPSRASR